MKRRADATDAPLRIVPIAHPPSIILLKACAAFGIALHRGHPRTARLPSDRTRAVAQMVAQDRRARIILVCGPSGSGKSILLREIARQLRRGRARLHTIDHPRARSARPIIDRLRGPLHRRLALLGRAGLSEPALLPRSIRELSDGQRHRFALASAIGRAAAPHRRRAGHHWLLADEFASVLDRTTARSLCLTLSRWLRLPGSTLRAILATAHEDAIEALRPDTLIWCSLDGSIQYRQGSSARTRAQQE